MVCTNKAGMTKRIRAKRINFEVTDEAWDDIHTTIHELNITIRAYIWRLVLPDLINRKLLREGDNGDLHALERGCD